MSVSTQDHWIETPRGRLFARRWSPVQSRGGAPLILFHDSLGSVELWRDFPQRLASANGREVIAYDRLGFGRSDAFSGDWSAAFIEEEAQQSLPALREQLAVGDFIAFGHSVGGAMAAICAARYPRACRALVTIAAQAFVEERTRVGIREARDAFADPAQFERLQRYHGDKARWVLNAWTETWLSDAFAGWTLEPLVSAVGCPLLVIHGAEDEYGSLAHPRRIAELAAGRCETLILDGLHHVPQREAPEVVLESVARFLQVAVTD